MTNLERIQQMSAEELAEALYAFKNCEAIYPTKKCPMLKGKKHCYYICTEEDVIRRWLESEVTNNER